MVSLHQVGLVLLIQEEVQSTSKPTIIANMNRLKISTSHVVVERPSEEEVRKSTMGARATDSARVMKFTKVLSGTMVILGILTLIVVFFSAFFFFFWVSLIDFFLVTPIWPNPVM